MLDDDDVREILRLIDESALDELRIETEGFSLHVLRGAHAVPVEVVARSAAAAPAQAPPAPTAAEVDGELIEAPMLGTFYRAEAPGAKPFVEVGAQVEPDTIVCLIEVMKMMNSVPARTSGTIVEVCVENAVLVEYGQALFRVKPHA
jgi:acetyl-CoA carboxylase biotin carboxyl carrier protein